MRVRLHRLWATADFNRAPGAEVEVDATVAHNLVDQGAAEALEAFPIDPTPPAPPLVDPAPLEAVDLAAEVEADAAATADLPGTPPPVPTPKRRRNKTAEVAVDLATESDPAADAPVEADQ